VTFLHVYPLLLEPTPRAGLDRVRDFNLRPRDAKPFQSYLLPERNQHMSNAADEIAEIAAEVAARKGPTVPSKSTAPAPAFVHINGLPETGYERLVGRDTELIPRLADQNRYAVGASDGYRPPALTRNPIP